MQCKVPAMSYRLPQPQTQSKGVTWFKDACLRPSPCLSMPWTEHIKGDPSAWLALTFFLSVTASTLAPLSWVFFISRKSSTRILPACSPPLGTMSAIPCWTTDDGTIFKHCMTVSRLRSNSAHQSVNSAEFGMTEDENDRLNKSHYKP